MFPASCKLESNILGLLQVCRKFTRNWLVDKKKNASREKFECSQEVCRRSKLDNYMRTCRLFMCTRNKCRSNSDWNRITLLCVMEWYKFRCKTVALWGRKWDIPIVFQRATLLQLICQTTHPCELLNRVLDILNSS